MERHPITIKPELFELFPTLLSKGNESMQQLTIKVDNANGQILKSAQPIIVSSSQLTIIDWLCAIRWLSSWWTQRYHGLVRYDQKSTSRKQAFWIFERAARYLH